MKRVIFLLSIILLANFSVAQVTLGFNYQAVIRNAEGEPLQSQDVSLQISLLNGQDDILYSETHSLTTSPQGVVSITVGQAQDASSNFADIPWSEGEIRLRVEVDPAGGNSFTLLGITPIRAVPYALYALGGNQGESGQDGVGIQTITHNANGTLTITLTDGESYTTSDITGSEGPQGPAGPAGTGLNNRGAWISGAIYESGDYVFDDSSDDPTVNSMWIVQAEETFTSTIQPKDEPTNWVEFQAPQGDVGPEGSEGPAGIGIEYQWQGTQLGIKREDEGAYSFADLMGPTGSQGEPGIPIQWLGEFPTHPASPLLNQAYYNTSQGISFVYDGESWEVIAKDGEQGSEGPIMPGSVGQTLRHDGSGWVTSDIVFNNGTLVGIGTTTPTEQLEVAGNIKANRIFVKEGDDEEELLFAVRNSEGKIVLAVYETGVRVYVDDTNTKGRRSGFAIGGLSDQTKDDGVDYFRLTPDSVRFNINMTSGEKGRRSGFAIGGLSDQTKGKPTEYFSLDPDNVRFNINTPSNAKGRRSGFAIGGLSDQTKENSFSNLFFISPDSARIYIDASETKGRRSGFAIGGLSDQTKANPSTFFSVSPDEDETINPSEPRILWYPLKNAFLAGQVLIENPASVGENSLAIGFENKASGDFSQAIGFQSEALGDFSSAIGKNAIAEKTNSFAFGENARAEGIGSYAIGSFGIDTISGNILGNAAHARGDYSVAIGLGAETNNLGSFAIGTNVSASGNFSMALGVDAVATGIRSYAIGSRVEASGNQSIAIGTRAEASGFGSYAIGPKAMALTANSFAIGVRVTADSGDEFYPAFAYGYQATSSGLFSMSMGYNTTASGSFSLAMGDRTNAIGQNSSAFGYFSTASGNDGFAAGFYANASGDRSFALGSNVTTYSGYETVVGRFNTEYTPSSTTSWNNNDRLFVIGNGTSPTNRSNALTVLKNGRIGIGTLSPSERLHINSNSGEGSLRVQINGLTRFLVNDDQSVVIGANTTSGPSRGLYVFGSTGIGVSDPETILHVNHPNNASNGLSISNSSTSNRWHFYVASGNFLRLYYEGEHVGGFSNSSGSYGAVSDSRLKTNISKPIDLLDKVLNLNIVEYNFINQNDDKRHIGLIAQDVEKILPSLVNAPNNPNEIDEYYTLDYSLTGIIAIKAIQEQQTIIEKQNETIETLNQTISNLENRLMKLEKALSK